MALTEAKQKAAAKAFAKYWEDKGYGFHAMNFAKNNCVTALMEMYYKLTAKEGN